MAKKSTRTFTSSRPPPLGMDGHSIRNEILLSLPSKECTLVFSKLTLVELKLHDPLHESGEHIDFVYFPKPWRRYLVRWKAERA